MRIRNTHAHTHDVYTCFIHTNPQTIGAQGFRRIHFHLYSFCVHLKSLICSQFFTSSFSPIVTFSSPKLLYRSHKKRLPKHHLTFWKTLFSSLHSIFSIASILSQRSFECAGCLYNNLSFFLRAVLQQIIHICCKHIPFRFFVSSQ